MEPRDTPDAPADTWIPGYLLPLTVTAHVWTTLNRGGVKVENQNAPLLIRPSRTPKTNPKKNFCSKSLPTMGARLACFTF